MPGSITYDPGGTLLAGFATPIGVYRYTPTAPAGQRYTLLPNVVCEHAGQYRDGAEPAVARFRYVFDGSDPTSPFPRTFAEVWPLTASGPYVMQPDDEIAVRAFTGQGRPRVMFHGFVQIPQVDLGEDGHAVSFTAASAEIRLWDKPISSARYRDGDDPEAGQVVLTDLDVRFNPAGSGGEKVRPNCTPSGEDGAFDVDTDPVVEGDDDGLVARHPVFLDDRLVQDPEVREYWTLGKAIRYLLACHNDEEYTGVDNPDFAVLDEMLNCYAPNNGEFYDPEDPSTFTARPIVLRDYDATNKPLPDVLEDLLGYHGFGFKFVTEEDELGDPWHTIEIFRKDAAGAGAPASLLLQAEGAVLDFGRSNVGELHAARDTQSIANEFVVATDPILYEVSVVLAPMFEIAASDATDENRKNFLRSAIKEGTGPNRYKYRRYGVDECGEGHWDVDVEETDNTPFDFGPIFASLEDEFEDAPTYVRRLRPGRTTLLNKDAEGKPRKDRLDLSRDYAGACPAIWDGTGTWQSITSGWETLKDRLGILVTADNPDAWNVGDHTGSTKQNPDKTIRGIKAVADPDGTPDPANAQSFFYLRYTTVIEGDFMLSGYAGRRDASPTRFAVRRRVDARDHFRQEVVSVNTVYNVTEDEEVTLRDDSEKARAHAEALRAVHEFAPLAGSVTIPWISFSYEVGQTVDVIDGRGISLRTNIGSEAGEAPSYPFIVSKAWDLSGGRQRTVLQLSDRRAEPRRA
jgi:hypothetical protein